MLLLLSQRNRCGDGWRLMVPIRVRRAGAESTYAPHRCQGRGASSVMAPRDFQRVSTGALAGFGASGLAQNIVGTCLGVHLFIFYTDEVGLAPLWVSAALFVATLWDAVFGIAMGQISDRTRWSWGRRRPYILLGALPFGLTFAGILSPPAVLGGSGLGVYLAALLLLQFTAANVVHVPALGLIPEMAQSYHERTRMAAWREALGNVGDLIGLLLPFALRAALSADAAAPAAEVDVARSAYAITGICGGALAAVALFATYCATYEDPDFRRAVGVPFRAGIAALRHNDAFRVLAVSSALAALSLAFVGSMFLYVLTYVVGISDPLVQGAVFVANIAGALASYPFWISVARRRGKASAFRLGLIISSVAFMGVFVLQPGRLVPLIVVMAFAGAANVGFWVLLYALNADIAEVDELETGERREGLFAGFAALLRKCAFAVAAGMVGIGLALVGYRPHAVQTPTTLLGIKLLFAVPTTLLVVAAWFAFRHFPLSSERWAEVAAQLDARRVRTEDD